MISPMRIFLLLGVVGTMAFAQTSLVLYSSGFALVEETRKFQVSAEGALELFGFPEGTIWDSFVVEGIDVLALRPLPTQAWSVTNLLGKEITVQTEGGAFRGILREVTRDGLVLETEDGVMLVREYAWLRGPSYTPPKAQALLYYRAEEPGEKELRFRYLTQGLSWEIVYEAEFSEESLKLLGRAVIQNETGVDWQRSKLTLIAGELRGPAKDTGVRALAMALEAVPGEAFEYHRYDLPGVWDLPQGRTALPLVRATLPATKVYQFTGMAVEVRLRFTTPDAILPAGEMRVYSEGIFVGASTIGHLSKGESAEITLGAAFDLTGKRVQVKRERLGENLFRDTWRIELFSAKTENVVVEVVETLSGYWRIISAALPYEVLDAQRVKFAVPVGAGSKASLEYTVEWHY